MEVKRYNIGIFINKIKYNMNTNPLLKKYLGYYMIWSFMHLVFLAIGWNGNNHEYFWPFSGNSYSGTIKKAYDFSEFLVYVFGPIVLLLALSYIIEGGVEKKIDDEIKRRS
jgi:hypothetical protein